MKLNYFIFQKTETKKKKIIFQETKLSYISGNENSKTHFIHQGIELSEL